MPDAVIYHSTISDRFDLNDTAQLPLVLPVQGRDLLSAAVTELSDDTPSAFVVTLEWSLDGRTWSAFSVAKTVQYNGTTNTGIDIKGLAFVRARVSTAEGAACTGKITLYAERTT